MWEARGQQEWYVTKQDTLTGHVLTSVLKKKSDTGGASTSSSSNCDSLSGRPQNVRRGVTNHPQSRSSSVPVPSFSSYMKEKEANRRSHFKPKNKKARSSKHNDKDSKDEVLISAGLMEYNGGKSKPLRGKTFPVKLSKDMGYEQVLECALKKWEAITIERF